MTEHDAVLATLDVYAETYCAKDIDGLMGVFVEGEEISLIGTGADELCAGRMAIRAVFERNFGEATAERFEWLWKDVAIHGDLATVAITLNIHLEINGDKLAVPIRWTVVLVKVDGAWKWVHRHASAAADAQEDGAAYPVDGR